MDFREWGFLITYQSLRSVLSSHIWLLFSWGPKGTGAATPYKPEPPDRQRMANMDLLLHPQYSLLSRGDDGALGHTDPYFAIYSSSGHVSSPHTVRRNGGSNKCFMVGRAK